MSKNKSNVLVKLPPMRTSEDVVNRIQHDERIDKSLVIVGYLDRFLGVIEKKFTSFVWCKVEMASYLDLAIPKHRIEYFKYHGEVVWSKKDRIDKVFGSSKSENQTILEVIERHAAAIEAEKLLAAESQLMEASAGNDNKQNHGHSGPLRPTHFICIPFTNSSIKMSVNSIQKEVSRNASRLGMNATELENEGCIPLSALHITLVMLYCPTPQSILDAKRVFESYIDLLNLYTPRHLLLTLQGVNSFDERVIYSPPIEIGRLTKLVTEMKSRLKSFGVRLVGNHDPYSPHMTLVKLNRKLSKSLNFDGSTGRLPRSLFQSKEGEILGQQACESIQFCELYSPKDVNTGFYRCIASLTNTPSSIQSNYLIDNLNSQVLINELLNHQPHRHHFHYHQGGKNDKVDLSLDVSNFNAGCLVVIMRGLPGHGKSFFSKKILTAWSDQFREKLTDNPEILNAHCVYLSVDDLMGNNFDASLLSTHHLSCQEKCREVLIAHTSQLELEYPLPTLILIDNTNTVPDEYLPYQSLASQYGAKVVILELDISYLDSDQLSGQTNVNFTPTLSCKKILSCSKSNGVHNVPTPTLLRMWSRWIPDPSALIIRRKSFESSLIENTIFDWSKAVDLFNQFLPLSAPQYACQYLGVILDEESRQLLLQCYPPSHSCIRAHHVTLVHMNEITNSFQNEPSISLGEICEIKVFGEIRDSNCQGLAIEVSSISQQDNPLQGHITVSHDPSVNPKYTKKLLESRDSGQVVEYRLRDDSDPLILRGIVSACISRAKHLDFCSYPVDFWNIYQSLSGADQVEFSESKVSKTSSRFRFDNITPAIAQKVYIFDFDDTLFRTPNPIDYKNKTGTTWQKPKKGNGRSVGGWFCNPDSLDLTYEYPACSGLVDLFDRVGENNSSIIILTGRHEELKSKIVDILGSRSLLSHITTVVCKPTMRENTTDFKAEYLVDLCHQCPQIKLIEIWDDKEENLTAMMNAIAETSIQNIEFITHLVNPADEPISPRCDAIMEWGERNNTVLSPKQLQSRNKTIEIIRNCWTEIYEKLKGRLPPDSEPTNTSNSPLVHVFGSFIFERNSDIDLVLIVPKNVLGNMILNCQWMKLLEAKLMKIGELSGFRVNSYCGTTGTVPKMTLNFRYDNLPSSTIDVIGLVTDSLEMLNSQVSLCEALEWNTEELNTHYQQSTNLLTTGDFNVLYGLSIRNSCISTLQKASVAPRQFGCLIGAARRLMDRAFAMGTIRCGMRPYLIATTLANVISQENFDASSILPTSQSILNSWIMLHCSKSEGGIGITSDHLKCIYPGGIVADTHLNRIFHTFQAVGSFLSENNYSEISLLRSLDTLLLPNESEFRTISIQMIFNESNTPTESEQFSAANVMYGILSKYIGRMIRDGHDIISSPSVYSTKMQPEEEEKEEKRREGSVEIATFGISRHNVEVFEFVFHSICKDFELVHKHRKLKLAILG